MSASEHRRRCCCPICATVEGLARARAAVELISTASEAWCDYGTEDEMAAAYLYDEVQAVLALKPWQWRSARKRLRAASLLVKRGPLSGDWTNAVPMLANMARTPRPLLGVPDPTSEDQ